MRCARHSKNSWMKNGMSETEEKTVDMPFEFDAINEQIRNIAQKRGRLGRCPKPHQEPEVLGFPTFEIRVCF